MNQNEFEVRDEFAETHTHTTALKSSRVMRWTQLQHQTPQKVVYVIRIPARGGGTEQVPLTILVFSLWLFQPSTILQDLKHNEMKQAEYCRLRTVVEPNIKLNRQYFAQ
jgi:hypothetical protein